MKTESLLSSSALQKEFELMSKWRREGVKEGIIIHKTVSADMYLKLLYLSEVSQVYDPGNLNHIQRNLTKIKCICLKCDNVPIKCSRNQSFPM